jgi:predicted flap endonuclease-1-like 5' DNA nuclease
MTTLACRNISSFFSKALAAGEVIVGTRCVSTFNINNALKKGDEGLPLRTLVEQHVTTLQGIGPVHTQDLESLGLRTIGQLADYKFFHLARSIAVLSETEEDGERADGSAMNLFKGVDKEHQSLSLKELVNTPVHVLKGIHPDTGGAALNSLGVKTVGDLAQFKYCRWAEAIVVASKFEADEEK